ncbi:hypothetical protein PRJ_Dakar_00327 [Faustovirus]|nr:hypothetical protein PRJ_Dakar_00327 [Faustovirus]
MTHGMVDLAFTLITIWCSFGLIAVGILGVIACLWFNSNIGLTLSAFVAVAPACYLLILQALCYRRELANRG